MRKLPTPGMRVRLNVPTIFGNKGLATVKMADGDDGVIIELDETGDEAMCMRHELSYLRDQTPREKA